MERGRGFIARPVNTGAKSPSASRCGSDSPRRVLPANVPKDQRTIPTAAQSDDHLARKYSSRNFRTTSKPSVSGFSYLGQHRRLADCQPLVVDALTRDVLRAKSDASDSSYYRVIYGTAATMRGARWIPAAFCGQSGPGIAHLWHMPGGIPTRR